MYLLAISIGPVQDFISTARRSRDLWFGSWLLSEISKSAALYLFKNHGELIFPSPEEPATALESNSEFSVVNKLLARIDVTDISQYCELMQGSMSTRLNEIKNAAFGNLKRLKIDGRDAIYWKHADDQLNDLIEFYWAACPLEADNYERTRKQTDALLAARKVTRNFEAVGWGDHVPKSSLDGLRESVIDEVVFDPLDNRGLSPEQKAQVLKRLRTQYGVRGKERLCGVGLLKRHGKPTKKNSGIDNFYSTSHLAALPLLQRLKDTQKANNYVDILKGLLDIDDHEVKAYLGHVPKNATLRQHPFFSNSDGSRFYDGHLLFKERLREFFPEKAKRESAEAALSTFLQQAFGTAEDPNPSPHPYYAILHADGDHMGQVIDAQSTRGYIQHQKLSGALSKFSGQVKTIVEVHHYGSSIYSGGDDVLALLPLHEVVQCARSLAAAFEKELGEFAGADGKTPTLSIGIAIGHHLDPLQDTLNLAREAERIAKSEVPNRENPEKNALAITLSKRSGVDRTIKGSWDQTKREQALDYRLAEFVFLLLENELPDGVAFELNDLALRLKPPKEQPKDDDEAKLFADRAATLLAAQRDEAKRIFKRKQPKQGAKPKPSDAILERFCGVRKTKDVQAKLGLIDYVDLDDWTLTNLADEIIVAREIARAIQQAGNKTEFARAYGLIVEKEPVNGGE